MAWSYLSDRIGRKPVYLFGCIAGTVFFPLFFMLADAGSVVLLTIGIVIGLNKLRDAIVGHRAVYFAELFGANVRRFGASIGYQMGGLISARLAALIATALLAWNHRETWGISIYVGILGVINIIGTLLARETLRESFGDSHPATLSSSAVGPKLQPVHARGH